MSVDGRTEYVHRLILRLDGVLDEEMTVDHLCRRIDCFNPNHLERVTRAENARRSQMGGARRERTCINGHRKSEVGGWRGGACKGCHPDGLPRPNREPLIPRERRADVDVVCANGHRYDEVGRYPSGGCKTCQLAKDLARRKGPRLPQQFCVRGHDVTVVGRSPSNGECRQCARDYAREKYGYKTTAEDLVTSCRRGHPRERTVLVTRTRDGKERQEKKCLDCRAEALAKHTAKKAASG
jgi:hypothetical protein